MQMAPPPKLLIVSVPVALFSMKTADSAYSGDIVRVLEYMQTHLAEPVKMEVLAEIAGLSTT